jgi:hypothetical protein
LLHRYWQRVTHNTAATLSLATQTLASTDSNPGLAINPLTPNDFERRRAVSPLKIKIPCKNKRKKPTNIPIIHSVY